MRNKKMISSFITISMLILLTLSFTVSGFNEQNIELVDYQNIDSLLAPDLVYSPTTHDFGIIAEGVIYTTNFDIWNAGTDTLNWTLGIVNTWLSPTPTSGNSTGEVDTTGFTPGSYVGKVAINSNDGGGIRFFTVYFAIDSPSNSPPNTPADPIGPTTVEEGVQYLYITSASDPDDDPIKIGFDFNNDGIINEDHWSEYFTSGATYNIYVTFYGTGTRYLRIKAEDIHGLQSDFSNPLTVVVTSSNDPPNTPSKPSGPSSGEPNIPHTFSTSTTDPNDDNLRYGWDWNGDGVIDEWSSMGNSGSTDSRSHTWSTAGTYYVKVLAQDEHEGHSEFSLAKTVVISSNIKPNKPTISGPSSGRIGRSYVYTSTGIDTDGDKLEYWFDWGDGTNTGWKGPYSSGQTASESHSWISQGTYSIKVKTRDSENIESVWSDALPISMAKNKAINISLLQFLENHPHLFPLLQRLILQ